MKGMSKNFLNNGISFHHLSNERFAVIIPAYNESSFIGDVVGNIIENYKMNVCVVDDASSDNTFELAKNAGAVVVKHEINKGKGSALKTGFKWAVDNDYTGIFVMDADGQHLPSEIQNLKKVKIEKKSDIVIGTRNFTLENMPFQRVFTNKVTSLVCSIFSGKRIHDSQCGFRFISTEVLKSVKLKTSRFQTETELIIRAARSNYKINEAEISTLYGSERSHINPVLDTLRFLKLLWEFIYES